MWSHWKHAGSVKSKEWMQLPASLLCLNSYYSSNINSLAQQTSSLYYKSILQTFVVLCPTLESWLLTLFATPWSVACQAPLSMGFSRQECWSGWPFPPPGDLPGPGIEHESPALQEEILPVSHVGSPLQTFGLPYHFSYWNQIPYISNLVLY